MVDSSASAKNVSGSGKLFQTTIFQIVRSPTTIILFLCFVLLFPFLLQLPASAPSKADAIVILGGGKGDRVKKSLDLYREGYARNIVLTGIKLSHAKSHQGMTDSRAEFLIKHQVRLEEISYLIPSENSWEEAQSTQRMMQQRGWKDVIVVSDPPHMLRLSYSWGKAFRGYPKHFTLVATEPAWWSPLTWWDNKTSAIFVLSEFLKLSYYAVSY
jgi:hypothetical protein